MKPPHVEPGRSSGLFFAQRQHTVPGLYCHVDTRRFVLPGHFVYWHMTYETGDTRATLVEILTYDIWTPRTHRDKVNTRLVEGRGVDPKNIVSFLDNWIFFFRSWSNGTWLSIWSFPLILQSPRNISGPYVAQIYGPLVKVGLCFSQFFCHLMNFFLR